MRIQQVVSNFTANGQVGPWLKHDYYETPFDMTLLIAYGTALAATIAIDYVPDDFTQDSARQVSISQTTTVITVTDNGPPIPAALGGNLGHCLAVGDFVQLVGTTGGLGDGGYPVATVTSNTVYTLTSTVSQTLALQQATAWSGRILQAATTDNIIKLAPVTARASIGVTNPVVATRLHVTAFTTGGLAALVAVQGGVSS